MYMYTDLHIFGFNANVLCTWLCLHVQMLLKKSPCEEDQDAYEAVRITSESVATCTIVTLCLWLFFKCMGSYDLSNSLVYVSGTWLYGGNQS